MGQAEAYQKQGIPHTRCDPVSGVLVRVPHTPITVKSARRSLAKYMLAPDAQSP